MPSEPSGSSMTTGRLRTPSVDKIATCGWLITGTVISVPKPPALVMVKVPPEMSSIVSRLERARDASPDISRAKATSRFSSARWTTGHQQTLEVEVDGNAEIDLAVHDQLVFPHGRVEVGPFLQSVDDGPRYERQVGQAEPFGRLEMLPLGQAGPLDSGVVNLHGHRRVRRGVLGTHHVFRGAPPDVREGHDRVALAGYWHRPGRDDAGRRCSGRLRGGGGNASPGSHRPTPPLPAPSSAAGPAPLEPCRSIAASTSSRVILPPAPEPGYLGRVQAVFGNQATDDGREELARAALGRRTGRPLVGGP